MSAPVCLLPVIFRKSAGEIVAIFPTEPWNMSGEVTCYTHLGQHGAASWIWYRSQTKPAKSSEFLELLRELRGLYEIDGDCVLQICRRLTQTHKQRFNSKLDGFRKGETNGTT